MIKVWAVACLLIGVLSSCLIVLLLVSLCFTLFNPDYHGGLGGLLLALLLTTIFSILSSFVGWRLWRSDKK
jgi:hypothetical protein